MSNIGTVFFKVYLKKSNLEQRLTPEKLLQFLSSVDEYSCNRFWFTYNYAPVWSGQITPDGFALQFGCKAPAIFEIEEFQEYAEQLEAIWVRYNYDAAYPLIDEIYHIDHVGQSESRQCRYGYDLVRVAWNEQQSHLDKGETNAPLEIPFQGSYVGGNERCRWGNNTPSMPSPTTPAYRERIFWDDMLTEYQATLPPILHFLYSAIGEHDYIQEVQFFWQGRLVLCLQLVPREHRRQNWPQEKWDLFFMDDWDNCIDEEWCIWNGQEP